ncbi:MAG: orc1/cdc6 family replication initiation protein [Candidatus Aenigmarchaeota archaeon]|nr:orc1/cdc6 family replication initiation protein [Candidatus Aenigmarchaeota archaeon]
MVQQTLTDIFGSYSTNVKGVFRNKDVLSHTYIPDMTLHREQQIKTLASILAPAVRGSNISNCFLYGKTGTGKTMVATHVTHEIQKASDRVRVFYVNCKMRGVSDTEYRLLAELSRMLGRQVPITGLPTDEVYNIFYSALNGLNKNVILVMDEIDALVSKIGDGILYNITREKIEGTKLSIVGISNSVSFLETIDPRVKSSLSEEELIFAPYNSRQLADILNYRAGQAFEDGVLQGGVVEKCSALAAQEHGDARKALDLLRIAGELAEREKSTKVEVRHVDMAEDKLDSDRVIEVLINQPKQSMAVLSAIIKLVDSKAKDIQTGDIFSVYESMCPELGLKCLTQRRVSDLIAELDMLGIINTKVISKGRYGRTREIRIQINNATQAKIRRILKDNYML